MNSIGKYHLDCFAKPINHRAFSFCISSLAGSLFLALMAQISLPLPFTPVPMTMQSLALFLLVIVQGKYGAAGSVICYLVQATAGLPVLASGISNPLWIFYPRGGYLLGFLIFSLVAGTFLEMRRKPHILWTGVSLVIGQVVLLLVGTLYLSLFVGLKSCFEMGFIPFIASGLVQILCACSASVPINSLFKSKEAASS